MLRQPNGFFVGFTLRSNTSVKTVFYRIFEEKRVESGNSKEKIGFYSKNVQIMGYCDKKFTSRYLMLKILNPIFRGGY